MDQQAPSSPDPETGLDPMPMPSLRLADGRAPVILQVLPAMVSGGVERGTIEISEAVVQGGGKALVASAGGSMDREFRRLGVSHILLPLRTKSPWKIFRNAGRLERLIREYRVDLVHARSRAPAWSARIAARRTGVRFVTTLHDAYRDGSIWTRWFRRPYNRIMARGDRVIAISQFVAEYARTIHRTPPDRLTIIPRGVDLRVFDIRHTHPNRVASLAARWRLPDGVPVVMIPGRVSRTKGHDMLIEALGLLGRRDLVCLVVGDTTAHPRYARSLVQRAASLGLQPGLLLTGPCRDLDAAYMLADLVVVPSRRPEAFGRVIIEAQAMGKPVIASQQGGAVELIRHGETGWLYPPGDIQALAALIEQLLALKTDERDRLSMRTREHIARHYRHEIWCARTLELYRSLLSDDPGPG